MTNRYLGKVNSFDIYVDQDGVEGVFIPVNDGCTVFNFMSHRPVPTVLQFRVTLTTILSGEVYTRKLNPDET